MTKQLVVISAAIMTTLLALTALWVFRDAVLYVIISLVLAATFRPIAQSESRHNFTTRLLLRLQYVLAIVVVLVLIFVVAWLLLGDFQQLALRLSQQTLWGLPPWLEGSRLQQFLNAWVPTPNKLFESVLRQREVIYPALLSFTQGLGGLISGALVILFLSVYWSVNQNHFERLWLSLLPAEQRKYARYIWREIEHDLGAYTRSEILQSALAVVLLGIGYWLLGSPYPALLAVTGGFAWLVPIIGAPLALILPFLLGLLNSLQLSIISVLYTLLVLVILQIWIEPRLFKPKLDNPILTFVILLAMADAFGLLGIIVAPPISVICQILWRLLVNERLATDTAAQVLDIKERKARLQQTIDRMEGTPPPLVLSSMERLTELVEKAEPILRRVPPPQTSDMLHPPDRLPG